MTDLYLGFGILALVSLLAYRLAGRLARRVPPRVVDGLVLLTVVCVVVYVAALWNDVYLASLLPYSNLIVLGNWFPPMTAFVVGLAWHRRGGRSRLRKGLFLGSLTTLAWFSALAPLNGTPPTCRDVWAGEVCLQTSRYTCSAACAATVLRSHGIPADEREMAELCLTRDGTTWQGLYRGLKWKTEGTPWDVEVFHGTLEDLRRRGGPVIISVQLPADSSRSYYTEEWGWVPGQSHSVVFYEFHGDHFVRMGEPTVGLETWHVEELSYLWQGFGVRLVPRGEKAEWQRLVEAWFLPRDAATGRRG